MKKFIVLALRTDMNQTSRFDDWDREQVDNTKYDDYRGYSLIDNSSDFIIVESFATNGEAQLFKENLIKQMYFIAGQNSQILREKSNDNSLVMPVVGSIRVLKKSDIHVTNTYEMGIARENGKGL